MQWQATSYILPTLIASALSVIVTLFAVRRYRISQMLAFAVLAGSVSLWTFFYAWELAAVELSTKLFFAKIQYIGIVSPPVAWVLYALHYSGQASRVTRRMVLLSSIIPVITLLLVWSNEYHHLIWVTTAVVRSGNSTFFVPTYGVWFWIHTVYSYIFLAIGTLVLLQSLVLSSHRYQYQIISIVISALAPWIANALYITKALPFPYFDLTPFGFAISTIVLAWGVRRFQLFDTLPIARHLLMEHVHDGFIVVDTHLRVLDLNRVAARYLNTTIDQAIGQSAQDVLEPLISTKLPTFAALNNWQQTVILPNQIVDVSASALINQRELPIATLITLRDITAERSTALHVQRQALVFANLHDSVMITDAAGTVVECNPAAETMYGYSASEIVGNPPIQCYTSVNPVQQQTLLNAWSGDQRWSGELPYQHRNGNRGTCELIIVPIFDQQQRIGAIGVSRDITERKRTEVALLRQRDLFASLFEIARVTSAQLDLDQTLQNALQVAVKLTGAEQGSIFLLDDQLEVTRSILARDSLSMVEQEHLVGRVMNDGLAGWVATHRSIALISDTHRDGRWLQLPDSPYHARSVLALPIINGERFSGIIMLLHSTIDHFHHEHAQLMEAAAAQISFALSNAQLYEIQQQLSVEMVRAKDAAEAMSQAKSHFLANMSHELRTPLTAILGYSDVLHDDLADGGHHEYVQDVERIQHAGSHLLRLINDVLDLSKIEAGKMELHWEHTRLGELLHDVIETIEPLSRANGNTFTVDPFDHTVMFWTDTLKLRRVLLNILGNAAKFTEHGDIRLTVEVESEPMPSLVFRVTDNGIGMSPDQARQLFGAFMQADASTTRRYGGTGLGLAISRTMCQLLGGDIEVASELGYGSTFTVQLPLHHEMPSLDLAYQSHN